MKYIKGNINYWVYIFAICFFWMTQNDLRGSTIDESRAIYRSGIIHSNTIGQSDTVDIDITNSTKLYLVVTDAGDNNSCDHADWISPRLINNEDTVYLTNLNWESASSGWSNVQINKSISGKPLTVNNVEYNNGIGSHSNSIIEYNLPEGFTRFTSICGLDKGGVDQGCGATVKFLVFTQSPFPSVDTLPEKFVNLSKGEIVSPNSKIKINLKMKTEPLIDSGQVFINIYYKSDSDYKEVLPNSPLGISRADEQFICGLEFIDVSDSLEIHDAYEMICGKRKYCENFGTEKIFSFRNKNMQPVNIVIRAYNDGVTFRYVFPDTSNIEKNILDEATAFVIPDNTFRWMQPYNISYEDFYPLNKNGISSDQKQLWGYPALCKINDQPNWLLITEANISKTNCATLLSNSNNLEEYRVVSPPIRSDFIQGGVFSKLPWSSPWRVLLIGNLADIVESTLVTDVSEPVKLTDSDWINPGPVSWVYWANNHGSKDFQIVKEYIDLAVEMNWPYILIDWEWDVMTNGGDIEDAVSYANSKGIKPLMWYNSGTAWLGPTPIDRLCTPESRVKEFSWLNKIGVFGIKVDFFAGDQQDMMKYYIEILEDAAKYHLMVNFHGATLPRGWSRTYPNLMSVEAVYGAEYYNNGPVLTNKAASHNTTLPFTRNVVGSMDYTPVTFSNSQHNHITTYGHELALSVVFESGLQHFADRPSAYKEMDSIPKDFLKNVPVTWDETKLIDGYPGEKVILARKKSNTWYIGGLNGKNSVEELELSFDYLDSDNYVLELIKDGADSKSFEVKVIKIKKGDIISVHCLPMGGFVGTITKKL